MRDNKYLIIIFDFESNRSEGYLKIIGKWTWNILSFVVNNIVDGTIS